MKQKNIVTQATIKYWLRVGLTIAIWLGLVVFAEAILLAANKEWKKEVGLSSQTVKLETDRIEVMKDKLGERQTGRIKVFVGRDPF